MKKHTATIIVITTIVLVLGSIIIPTHMQNANRDYCVLQMRNYNSAIASLGIHLNCEEIWSDPEMTKVSVRKTFDLDVPICPSGGTCYLEYRAGKHAFLPKMVCSGMLP